MSHTILVQFCLPDRQGRRYVVSRVIPVYGGTGLITVCRTYRGAMRVARKYAHGGTVIDRAMW